MLEEFIAEQKRINGILRQNGAVPQADARDTLLRALQAHLDDEENRVLTPQEAARLSNTNVETVRRALRKGKIDQAVRVKDLPLLKAKSRKRIENHLETNYDLNDHLNSILSTR